MGTTTARSGGRHPETVLRSDARSLRLLLARLDQDQADLERARQLLQQGRELAPVDPREAFELVHRAALRGAGHEVVGVSAVSEASLDRAELLLPGVPVKPVPDVVADAQLVVLAVPDDALTDLEIGHALTERGDGAGEPGGTQRPGHGL